MGPVRIDAAGNCFSFVKMVSVNEMRESPTNYIGYLTACSSHIR